MNSFKSILSLIFLASSFLVNSQDLERINQAEFGTFKNNMAVSPFLLKSLDLFEKTARDLNQPGHNNVFIEQVGSHNRLSTKISSSNATANFLQYGDGNNVQVDVVANEVNYNLLQNGDNNLFSHVVPSSNQPVKVNFNQHGNNNSIENFGSNSISNKLKININGDSKSLIIRNFQ